MPTVPVIIDTDPGIDDYFAIALANSAPILDIRAITAVAGNQTLEITAKNALDIAAFFNIPCPVAKGAAQPLNIPLEIAGYIHGETGLGEVVLPDSGREFACQYAWDIMYQEAVKCDGKLEIIALGPLTNVAIALLKYPDLHSKISRILLMGGSAYTGNATPYGEFNIYADPLAANIVFRSGAPLVMVGLNVTMKTMYSREELMFLGQGDSPISLANSQIVQHLFTTYHQFAGLTSVALHDALAVAYAINPSVLQCEEYFVAVETRSSLNKGRTVVDLDRCTGIPANCQVAMTSDRELMREMLVAMTEFYQIGQG